MCLSFCIFLTSLIIPISTFVVPSVAGRLFFQQATLTLSPRGLNTAVHFELRDVAPDSAPSLETVIQLCQGSDGVHLRGLAVYSNLTNGCEPIHDVRSKIQVHKIALVTVVNLKPPCTLQDLAVNAKKAGYFALILFGDNVFTGIQFTQKVMIPVTLGTLVSAPYIQLENILIEADLTEIVLSLPGDTTDLSRMETYFNYLFYWLLVGPSITLVWLIRKGKLCWMSERRANANENDAETGARITEESREIAETEVLHQRPEETSEIHDYSQGDNEQIIPLTSAQTGHTRQQHGTGFVGKIIKYCYRGFVTILACILYMILIIAALPLGISTPAGGFSFFRFDEVLTYKIPGGIENGGWGISGIILVAVLLWSTFQIFCFFLYSRFACSTTWVVPTNFSKLIRSEWFASNIYLLVLAVVVPYCSNSTSPGSFIYFATYNIICTVSNLLFIITVNKHKFVSRYVFYISVCMICAYIESDIVAVFYYALNSQASLNNLKLTALRTVAIGLTLTVSFSSCMHIIRKLTKPTESLFEGLSER